MATLTCTNKGCGKTSSDGLLDVKLNMVICPECGKPIDGVTEFTKRSMIGLGKVRKTEINLAFVVDCAKCKKRGQPNLKGNNAFCQHCAEQLSLSLPFIKAYQEYCAKQKPTK